MAQNTTSGFPSAAWVLSLVGGILIILSGTLLMAVGAFVLPHLDYSNLTVPPQMTAASIPALVSGIVGTMGAVGLVSGAVVLISAVMLLRSLESRKTWGVLILVFSVLSFLGLGGFIVGAVLGIIGGIMTLRWKPPMQQA
ncbi:MAG TPA: DUF6114 domain-containing protein [Conexivisphaerales archaeon]|nr:DUF6114 domain-containing protein [Conexivisphaerales archaeon]